MSEPPQTEISRVISAHAAPFKDRARNTSKAMANRLDRLELLLENSGISAELITSLNEYIKELRDEVKTIGLIRLYSVVLGTVLVGLLVSLVSYLTLSHSLWIVLSGPYYKASVSVASIAASVVILSLVIKGAFRTLADRHKEEIIPPNLKELLDAYKLLKP